MNELLTARAAIVSFIKKNEVWILPICKFIMGLIIFSLINRLGYATILDRSAVTLLASILTALLSPMWFFAMAAGFITLHVFYASIELSVFVGLFFVCLMLFYIRLFPKKSLIMVALLIAYYFNIPYIVPLFAGLFVGVGAVVPLVMGAFIWEAAPLIRSLVAISPKADFSLLSAPEKFLEIYAALAESLVGMRGWVFVGIVFALVVLITYAISMMPVDYSREIAICAGSFISIAGFLMANSIAKLGISAVAILFLTIVSALLLEIVNLFHVVLDYNKSERVQFQDEDYFYYVKVVPKIKPQSEKKEKKI